MLRAAAVGSSLLILTMPKLPAEVINGTYGAVDDTCGLPLEAGWAEAPPPPEGAWC